MTRLRTLVVSNHRTFRHVLARYVQLLDPCVEVVGEATTADEALLAVRDRQPVLVLLDLSLRPGNALQLVARMRCRSSAAVVVIGNELAADYRDAAIAAGALDYVDVLELPEALPEVMLRVDRPAGCGEQSAGAAERPGVEAAQPVAPLQATRVPGRRRTALRERLRTAPTGPKHGPYTTWQYVHLALALMIGEMILVLRHAPESGWLLALLACLGVIAALEARQIAMTHRVAVAADHRRQAGN